MDPLIRYCFAILSGQQDAARSEVLSAFCRLSDSRLEGLGALLAQLRTLNIETPFIKHPF